MLETKLTTCANLLYQWILPRVAAGKKLTVDLQDFQAWTAEFREKPFSDREILDALRQLKELNLINVSKTEVTLEVKAEDNLTFNAQLAAQMLLAESDRATRLVDGVRIISGSLVLAIASVLIGLTLVQKQPELLNTPHPWSVLGEKNIGAGK